MSEAVIVGYARTPIGKFGGGLRSLPAVELGAHAVAAALRRAGVAPDEVESVILGHVLQAGQGQITARQAATRAGIPMAVPGLTVNKVCLSGMAAVALADQAIKLDEATLVVAGGMESMTNAPYVLPNARRGLRMGDATLIDAMIHDGLWCAFEDEHMGAGSDRMNERYGITREAQDEWAARSHERAAAAWKAGWFDGQVVPVEVPSRKDEADVVDRDEGMRPGTTAQSLAGLSPAFSPDGTITAGNASQVSDGAASLVLASRERAAELGLEPLARVVSYGQVAGPDASLHHQPAGALRVAASKGAIDAGALEVYEINEAFASVALHSVRLLGLDDEKVNPNGGAVALGHPLGATGARLITEVLHTLLDRGGGRGAGALCGGGGQGDALIVETVS